MKNLDDSSFRSYHFDIRSDVISTPKFSFIAAISIHSLTLIIQYFSVELRNWWFSDLYVINKFMSIIYY